MRVLKAQQLNMCAVVFFRDATERVTKWCTEAQCNHWIDRMIQRYGNHVVGSDVYPNT